MSFVSDPDLCINLYCVKCSSVTKKSDITEDERCEKCSELVRYQCTKCKCTLDYLELCIQHQSNHCCKSLKHNRQEELATTAHSSSLNSESKNKALPHNCQKRNHSSKRLSQHLTTPEGLPNSYFCNKCSHSTSTKRELTKHIKARHTYVECAKCRCSFHYESMSTHRLECGREGRFQCTQCDYVAKRKYHLGIHNILAHTKKR